MRGRRSLAPAAPAPAPARARARCPRARSCGVRLFHLHGRGDVIAADVTPRRPALCCNLSSHVSLWPL
ncbi:hypothetical protein chiPu_0013239 [Chiloscyllium punctatum]|uniref:Uncharacterized protein n=1 Tax=Chiloscyllium punctatum TaxID=137246 RepID=A0A401SWK9_CHIPU|nr:hypothetical protein [Chiloscyllium punctatum]